MKVPHGIKVPQPQIWFAVLLWYHNKSTATPNLFCGTIGGTLAVLSVAVLYWYYIGTIQSPIRALTNVMEIR